MFSTYSFQEVLVTISNANGAKLSTKGQGTGSISISYSSSRTQKEVAADGSVVVSKLSDRSGEVDITVQQTSPIHKQLLKWYTEVEGDDSPSSDWANLLITIKSKTSGAERTCKGCAFDKLPDESFEAAAGTMTWKFICAEISTQPV